MVIRENIRFFSFLNLHCLVLDLATAKISVTRYVLNMLAVHSTMSVEKMIYFFKITY